jgi:hypothetical protein
MVMMVVGGEDGVRHRGVRVRTGTGTERGRRAVELDHGGFVARMRACGMTGMPLRERGKAAWSIAEDCHIGKSYCQLA